MGGRGSASAGQPRISQYPDRAFYNRLCHTGQPRIPQYPRNLETRASPSAGAAGLYVGIYLPVLRVSLPAGWPHELQARGSPIREAPLGRGWPCPFDGHAKNRRLFRLRIDMGVTSQRYGVSLCIGMGNAEG